MGPSRDNNNLQQTNRKLERRVKEMKMQADEEHVSLQGERDQVRAALGTRRKGSEVDWKEI